MRRWVNAKATDDFVKKELGLTGLKGTALKTHPNYPHLQDFRHKAEQKMMTELIDNSISTAYIWEKLRLSLLPEQQRAKSKAFQFYLCYATKYEKELFWNQYNYYRPLVHYGGSKEEMFVKVGIWAAEKRPKDYVKALLRLEYATKRERLENHYYQKFLELTQKKAQS